MKAVWVDAGSDADYTKLKALGIIQVFYDARWLIEKNTSKINVALAYLQSVRAKGFQPGIYICSQGSDQYGAWPSAKDHTGPEWADIAYDWVQKKIAPGTSGNFPLVDLNAEVDDIEGWVLPMMRRWRAHSPKRVTAWSMCAHKYPLVGAKAAIEMASQLGMNFKPQCYVDSPAPMTRVESASELDGWQSIGIPRERISPMLDASQLGEWWGGCAYTQGRLPQ